MLDLEYLSSISYATDSVLGYEYQAKGHDVEDVVIAHPTSRIKIFT